MKFENVHLCIQYNCSEVSFCPSFINEIILLCIENTTKHTYFWYMFRKQLKSIKPCLLILILFFLVTMVPTCL